MPDNGHRVDEYREPAAGADEVPPHMARIFTRNAVAARWGFASPSQFAGRYRRTHGQLPSHTLPG